MSNQELNNNTTNAILEFKLIKVFDKITKESNSKHSAVADHKQTRTGTEVSGTLVKYTSEKLKVSPQLDAAEGTNK